MMNWYKKCSNENEELWKKINAFYPFYRGSFTPEEYLKEREFISQFGFAMPTKEVINKIVSWTKGGKIIELGAGRGLWARLLKDAGANIVASDAFHISENPFFSKTKEKNNTTYFEVEKKSGEEHAKESETNDTLLLIWPDFRESGSEWQRKAVQNFKGNKILFIGESQGGATGSNGLWQEIEENWKFLNSESIPQRRGINDYVMLFGRK